MTHVWLVLLMGVGVYSLRMTGLLLPSISIPPRWEAAFQFVPIALLAALVVASLTAGGSIDPRQVVAAGGAGIVAWHTRKMWACIASGMLLYWLLRLLPI